MVQCPLQHWKYYQAKSSSGTPSINAWLPSLNLKQCWIDIEMAFPFAKNRGCFPRFPSPENVAVLTGYNTKMAEWEMCLVHVLRFFCSKTFYKHKRNEMFIRSGVTSYEQLLCGSFTSISRHQEMKKSISQSDMPAILLSNGHWKICLVRVEISISCGRMIVRMPPRGNNTGEVLQGILQLLQPFFFSHSILVTNDPFYYQNQ